MSAQGKEHGSEHIPTVVEFTLAPSDRGVVVARAAAHRESSQRWEIEQTAARAHLERV